MSGSHDEPPHEHHYDYGSTRGSLHEHHGFPHEYHGQSHGFPGPPSVVQEMLRDGRWRDLPEIASFLEAVGKELRESEETEIGGHEIQPASSSYFAVRYERAPDGNLQLQFNISWNPQSSPPTSGETEDPVGDKIRTSREG